MNLTKEQQLAVDLEGSNIIVSAGAGSGKTAVLSERVIRKLKDGVDIRDILILTFTNEAAGEMSTRIRKKMKKAGLDEQLAFLDQAYIMTFDAFALNLVKKYHYNKGLYMALGDTNSYYDAAWTDEYSKFTTEEPIVPDEPSVPEEPKEDNNNDINKDNTKEEDNTKDDNKDKDNEIELPVQDRENPLLWLLDKIIKFIVKLFKGRKK